jgi:hypothetical protein
VEQALTPPPHLGRWSCLTTARAAGISPANVQRLWAASDIKPHLSRTFKLSTDKRFEEKFLGCHRAVSRPAGEGAGAVSTPGEF